MEGGAPHDLAMKRMNACRIHSLAAARYHVTFIPKED